MKIKAMSIFIVLFSVVCGILTDSIFMGTLLIMCGMFEIYLSCVGKVSTHIFGAGYTILSGIICFQNGIYGLALSSFLILTPLQLSGIFKWLKKLDNENIVMTRKLTKKSSVLVLVSCILASLLIGSLLSLIPSGNLAFLDAASNVLCFCTIILLNLRYYENWYLYFLTNITDLIIWIINVINGAPNSVIMLIVSIWYVVFNIKGFAVWHRLTKKNKTNS